MAPPGSGAGQVAESCSVLRELKGHLTPKYTTFLAKTVRSPCAHDGLCWRSPCGRAVIWGQKTGAHGEEIAMKKLVMVALMVLVIAGQTLLATAQPFPATPLESSARDRGTAPWGVSPSRKRDRHHGERLHRVRQRHTHPSRRDRVVRGARAAAERSTKRSSAAATPGREGSAAWRRGREPSASAGRRRRVPAPIAATPAARCASCMCLKPGIAPAGTTSRTVARPGHPVELRSDGCPGKRRRLPRAGRIWDFRGDGVLSGRWTE